MKPRKILAKGAEYLAQVVLISHSTAFLRLLAVKMGAPMGRNETIFQALMTAGKTTDLKDAVSVAVSRLDATADKAAADGHGLNRSKIDRREVRRNT